MISLTEDRRMLGYESLSSYPNISHFVTTRHGGCGEGAYGSFNCSPYCGDDAEVVRRNQELLIEGMSHKPVALVIPRQTHGTDCMLVQDLFWTWPPDRWGPLLEGIDALVTNVPGYCLCISTADCVPVLLYDRKRQAVAAIHAGWRGTAGLIVRRVLQYMMEKYGTQPEDVIAAIGPSISQASFEVGGDVYRAFRRRGFDMSIISYKNEETGKYHIDLWKANRRQLLQLGVLEENIEVAGICTYINQEEFFSARRLGINSGRMLSGIMINEWPDQEYCI